MSVARFALGPRLKAHRERQGIALQDISDSTKIGIGLLSGLERNDVSQWPKGIFRRAFLRSYARAIDIPFEPVWAEFVQLFPEDGSTPSSAGFTAASPLRLTLAPGAAYRLHAPSRQNLLAAGLDLGVILAVAGFASLLSRSSLWMSVALTSIAYSTLATILLGGSVGRWFMRVRMQSAQAAHDDDLVIALTHQVEITDRAPATTAPETAMPVPTPAPRPRIVAVSSPRSVPTDQRERRVADR